MDYVLTVKTAPAGEPITRAETKTHLRIDDDITDQDALVDALIIAAREWAENYTRRSFVTRTYELRMDCFPGVILLPRGPVTSVTHVKYTDAGGTLATVSSGDYQTDTYSLPARITQVFGGVWPTPQIGTLNAVLIEYVAGYAVGSPANDYGSNVPSPIKAALKLIVGHLYEHRELVSMKQHYEVPFAVKALLAPYELRDFRLE